MHALRRRLLAAAALILTLSACGGMARRQYEYEEQLYLYADGSAAVVVNSSIAALIALHHLPLDPNPRARIDRGAIRTLVSEPGLEISRVSRPWRRHGRQFIQIRAETDDVRKLSATKLFGWSKYAVEENEETREYRQQVAGVPGAAPAGVTWDGSELVAFKLHLPSRILFQNLRRLEDGAPGKTERGNILTWEQRLTDRIQAKPIDIQVTMESGSILYRTLWVFGLSFAAAIGLLAFVVWRIVRRGRQRNAA
ncbi:MAG: hypothetical protein WD690_05090 [Vicinamibacterales bacterium]